MKMSVEDLFFLDDLKALNLPWVSRLVLSCGSHEDVKALWTIIRMWGPNNEDLEDCQQLADRSLEMKQAALDICSLLRIMHTWSIASSPSDLAGDGV